MIKPVAPFGALAAIVLLASATAPLERNQRFIVEMSGLELIPGEPLAGTERVVAPMREILRAKVGLEHGALVRGRTSITVSGLGYTLTPVTALLATKKARGGDLNGRNAFCANPERGRREGTGQARYAQGRERYAKETRLCLVDSDADQRFDKAFVVGTEGESDWRLTEIAPLAYTEQRHIDLGDEWYMVVSYFCPGRPPKKCTLRTRLLLNNHRMNLSSIQLGGAQPSRTSAETGFSLKTLPYRFAMGNAVFTVTALRDGMLTVRHERNFDYAPLDYSLKSPQPQIIFIYY